MMDIRGFGSRTKNVHKWVSVPDPTHSHTLLHACDNCGVVKSHNTLHNACSAQPNQHLISSALKTIEAA